MERFLFRLYNLPIEKNIENSLQAFLENVSTVKRIWIAKDTNGVCQGWGWIECHTHSDKDILISYLNGMAWRGNKLYVLQDN